MATPYNSDNLVLVPFPAVPPLPEGQQFEGALVRTPDGNGWIASPIQIAAQLVPTGGTGTSKPPTITLQPSATSTTAGKSIVLTATVTPGTAAVKQVEFFDGGERVGVPLTAQPYQATYTPQTSGTHALVAKVTDASGNAVTSPVVYVQVAAVGSVQPTVTLNPVTPTSAPLGTSYTLVASASIAGGSIAKVEFFDGAAKIGEDTSTPYALAYTPGSTGQHAFSAKATDLNGNSAISPTQTITITAVPTGPNQLPTVSLALSPASLTQGQSTTLTSTASDTDGTITKVEFFDGTTSLAVITAAPYIYAYTPAGNPGNRTIKAVATDDKGGTGAATQTLSITAAATAPGAPTIGASTAGDGFATTTATAPTSSGTSGILSYNVYRVGTTNKVGTVNVGQALTFTDSGLPNDIAVQYQWTAVSNAGESSRSAASAPVTPTAAPVAPTFTLKLDPGNAGVGSSNVDSLNWYTDGDGLNYELRYNASVAAVGPTSNPGMEVYYPTVNDFVGLLDFYASADTGHLCGLRHIVTNKLLYKMRVVNTDGSMGNVEAMKFFSGKVLITE